jgi:putative chitinase
MSVKLTTDILVAGCGCSSAVAGQWLAPMQAAMDQFGISDSPSAVAALLANVGVECAGFTVMSENLNYTATRLAQVWPQRYAVDAHSAALIPNNTAVLIANNPVATANNVYANRMGNGQESSGDGYNFRGQGPIQLTGRAEYMKFFAAVDMPLFTDTSELQQPDMGSLSAAWYFQDSGALDFGVQGNFPMTVEKVNGQAPCADNQGPLRQSRYDAVLPLCSVGNQPAKKGTKTTSTTQPPQ